MEFIYHETSIFSYYFVVWCRYFRDICTETILKETNQTEGEGKSAQINESLCNKLKYHCERFLPEQWGFGEIESNTKNSFVEIVLDRKIKLIKTD